jgi:hypothetical protein
MKIELVTKEDLLQVENKLEQLLNLILAGNGDHKIYNTQELAEKLKVSTKTIQNWRQQRLIEFSRVGSLIFYTSKSVEEFLAKHSIKRFPKY